MEGRAYRAEVGVAKALSDFYETVFASPVLRIPAMGSTGPDIQINEIGLVVDVKSRKVIPDWMFESKMYTVGGFFFVRISELGKDLTTITKTYNKNVPKEVMGWWHHMDEWRLNNQSNGLTAIILHKSNSSYKGERSKKGSMPYVNSILMIQVSDLEVLRGRIVDPIRRIGRSGPVSDAFVFRGNAER